MGRKARAGKEPSGGQETLAAAECAREAAGAAEELLESDPARALQLLEQALAARPTDQSAWYHHGVAASNLWELQGESEPPPSERAGLLSTALSSWARVVTLDTSTRSEARYLAATARGKLLARASAELHDEEDARPGLWESALAQAREADASFKEALRLHEQWGHPPLDGTALGAWAEALALEMKLTLEGMGPGAWHDAAAHAELVALCFSATERFRAATTAVDEEGMADASQQGDLHWMTLHAECLLEFVTHAVRALEAASAPTGGGAQAAAAAQRWRESAAPRWQEALRLAVACEQLQAESPGHERWTATMLRGDALAAGAALAGALGQHWPGAQLQLPGCPALPAASAGDQPAAAAPCFGPGGPEPGAPLDERGASAMAAAAYEAAAAAAAAGGAEAVAAAAMSRGELLLAHARRCARQGAGGDAASGREALSQAAGSFEELAARAADSESAATALYNLACARSMLGDADAAAAALGRCFKKLPKAGRARWANEMLEDDDLRWAREGSPELSAALTRAAGR